MKICEACPVLRLRGGGGDGGATGAESRDCYLKMYAQKKPDAVDPNDQNLARWSCCSLSGEPLREPCASDALGNLFNKEAALHHLVSKTMPPSFSHIRGMKDVYTLKLSKNPGVTDDSRMERFRCPVTGLEINGKFRFSFLRACGHVFSAKALKELPSSTCLECHTPFTDADIIPINGSEEDVKALKERMETERATKAAGAAKTKKEKRKTADAAPADKEGAVPEPTAARTGDDGTQGGDTKPRLKGSDRVVPAKKYKAAEVLLPAHATKEVFASLFTSSAPEVKETFVCRNMPLRRN
eukprot:jgi/Mesvir1/13205/Mv06164-RA.1